MTFNRTKFYNQWDQIALFWMLYVEFLIFYTENNSYPGYLLADGYLLLCAYKS